MSVERTKYQGKETLEYTLTKDGVIIEQGTIEQNDVHVCIPWQIQKRLPPNIHYCITRSSTGEIQTGFLPLNLKLHTPKFNKPRGNYRIDVSWDFVERNLERLSERNGQSIDDILNPPFQRGHVWTEEQQIAYIEYIIKGGDSGKDVYFNCATWNKSGGDPNVYCIDGLQRITAVRRFINNEIAIFDNIYLKDTSGIDTLDHAFSWHVLDFQSYDEILDWYIDLNDAGTPHTKKELNRVRKMKEELNETKK